MKRLLAVIMLIALLSAPIFVQAGYSLFVFTGTAAAEIKQTISATNTMFGEVSNDYYQVYFFASPYYATGTGTTPSTDEDPLTIANSENNPYNDKSPFCLTGDSHDDDGMNITLNGKRYASCIINKDENGNLLNGGDGRALDLTFYEKRDYTGYIRANEVEINGKKVTIEKTSTYVSFTVQGNIHADLLDAIVAQSEYKDVWGFGPEFIGWTADKEKTCSRTIYDGNRYHTGGKYPSYEITKTDSNTYAISESTEKVGYYGCQGVIEQVTSNTSLSALDESDKDGSKAGDKVIYLYPVFAAKNYEKTYAIEDKKEYTPMIKFRVNPGEKPGKYQSDEIDYSLEQQRYTVCLFQRKLVAPSATDTSGEQEYNVNYYTGDFYIDEENTIQLDYNNFNLGWATILDNDTIHKELSSGYYNVDMTFVFNQTDSDTQTALKKQYEQSKKYVFIYSGIQDSSAFVIGFQKVDDFRMVYEQENSTPSYAGGDYEQVYTVTDNNENRYYYVDEVYLDEGKKFQFMIESGGIKMTTMTGSSSLTFNGKNYSNGYGDDKEMSISDRTMTCNVAGYYSFLFTVDYQNGVPKEVKVAYLKHENKCSIVILSGNTEGNIFIGQTELDTCVPTWDENGKITGETALKNAIVAYYSADKHSTVSASGNSFQVYQLGNSSVTTMLVGTFLQSMQGKKLYDTATGLEVTGLFENGDFQLNRNYVLYIG